MKHDVEQKMVVGEKLIIARAVLLKERKTSKLCTIIRVPMTASKTLVSEPTQEQD